MLRQESDRIGFGGSHRYLGSIVRILAVVLFLVGTARAQQQIPSTSGGGAGGSVQITDGVDSALVSGSGSLQVTCDNCGGSTFADNSTFTFGTTNILNVGYVFDDVAPNAVTENRAATPRMSGNRVPYSILRDAAGNERGANVTAGNALVVDGSAVTQPISGTVTASQGTPAAFDAGWPIRSDFETTTTGTISSGGSLAASNLDGMNTVAVLLTPIAGASALNIVFEVSHDGGTNWISIKGRNIQSGAIEASASVSFAVNELRAFPLEGNATDFRVRCVSGTGSTDVRISPSVNGQSVVGITNVGQTTMALSIPVAIASNQSAVSVNVGTFPDNEPFNLAQVGGSAVTTVAAGTLEVGISDSTGASFLSAANALNSTGSGLQAVQVIGQFDDTTPTTITENQFGNIRMSANRNLFGTIRDAAGNERGANVNATNELLVSAAVTALPNEGAQTSANSISVTPATDAVFQVKGQNSIVPIFCTTTAFLNMTTATTTEIVALSGSTHVYVCSYSIHVGAAADVKLVSGTGTNCATSQADASTNYDFTSADVGINRVAGGGNIVSRTVDAGDALCVTSSAATDVDVEVSYAQF